MPACKKCNGSGKYWRQLDGFTRAFLATCPKCDGVGFCVDWASHACYTRAPAQNPRPAVEQDALDRQRGMTAWAKALWHREAAPAEPGVFQPLPEVGKDTSGGEAQRAHAPQIGHNAGGRP